MNDNQKTDTVKKSRLQAKAKPFVMPKRQPIKKEPQPISPKLLQQPINPKLQQQANALLQQQMEQQMDSYPLSVRTLMQQPINSDQLRVMTLLKQQLERQMEQQKALNPFSVEALMPQPMDPDTEIAEFFPEQREIRIGPLRTSSLSTNDPKCLKHVYGLNGNAIPWAIQHPDFAFPSQGKAKPIPRAPRPQSPLLMHVARHGLKAHHIRLHPRRSSNDFLPTLSLSNDIPGICFMSSLDTISFVGYHHLQGRFHVAMTGKESRTNFNFLANQWAKGHSCTPWQLTGNHADTSIKMDEEHELNGWLHRDDVGWIRVFTVDLRTERVVGICNLDIAGMITKLKCVGSRKRNTAKVTEMRVQSFQHGLRVNFLCCALGKNARRMAYHIESVSITRSYCPSKCCGESHVLFSDAQGLGNPLTWRKWDPIFFRLRLPTELDGDYENVKIPKNGKNGKIKACWIANRHPAANWHHVPEHYDSFL